MDCLSQQFQFETKTNNSSFMITLLEKTIGPPHDGYLVQTISPSAADEAWYWPEIYIYFLHIE